MERQCQCSCNCSVWTTNSNSICGYCDDCYKKNSRTFSEQMKEASLTMEARIEGLEAAVKRLNRELGLK